MSGLGGDELFYGYEEFRQIRFLRSCKWQFLAPFIRFLPWLRDDQKGCLGTILTAATDEESFFWVRALWSPQELKKIGYTPPIEIANNGLNNSILDRYSYFLLRHYMKNTLLRDTDVMSMANGLEVRVSLIDHKWVEFLLQLPSRLKWGDGRTPKYLLVKAVKDLLPKEIIYPKETGFELPFDYWMRYKLRTTIEQFLIHLEKREVFPNGFVNAAMA